MKATAGVDDIIFELVLDATIASTLLGTEATIGGGW